MLETLCLLLYTAYGISPRTSTRKSTKLHKNIRRIYHQHRTAIIALMTVKNTMRFSVFSISNSFTLGKSLNSDVMSCKYSIAEQISLILNNCIHDVQQRMSHLSFIWYMQFENMKNSVPRNPQIGRMWEFMYFNYIHMYSLCHRVFLLLVIMHKFKLSHILQRNGFIHHFNKSKIINIINYSFWKKDILSTSWKQTRFEL